MGLRVFQMGILIFSPLCAMADPADELCDPVTNVCYCTGGWDGPECTAMKPLCEPGFWQACTDDVCSCTGRTWIYLAPGETPPDDGPLPADRRAPS